MPKTSFHSFHTKRLVNRQKEIEKVFSIKNMRVAWKQYLRTGLRNQEVPDLHDFNDFHWSQNQVFARLHTALCSGSYAPQRSVPVRIEKKYGVTRTIVLPSVEDCIVLQCIVEALLPAALKKQPSRNSFFSRSHGRPQTHVSFGEKYIWFRQWKTLSNLRFEFISHHKYICITDIANYFDNVDYHHLRSILSSLNGLDEVSLDILFSVLDRVSWRPDYLPSPNRSLPQVNFDAPRLLSHIYLYEVDAYLRSVTKDQFVRWVDDITTTASSVSAGKQLLRDLDQLLLTRGLRLNSEKTKILSAKDARKYFHERENTYLNALSDRLSRHPKNGKRYLAILAQVRKQFDSFVASPRYGHSDKVIKRYLSHFTTTKDAHAIRYAKSALNSEPGIRNSVLRYFGALGPRSDTFKALRDYLTGPDLLDDASLMLASKILTEWEVRPNSRLHREIRNLADIISQKDFVGNNPFFFAASLWLMAKYGLRKHILLVINDNYACWSHSEFLARQVAATYGKFRGHKEGEILRTSIERLRFDTASAVCTSFDNMASGPSVHHYIRLYVLNGLHIKTYSIQRFLVCVHVLSSKKINAAARRSLKCEVLKYVQDPLYLRVIKSIKI